MSTDLKPGTRVQAILLDRNDDALVDLPGMEGVVVPVSEWPVTLPDEWTDENTVIVRWDDPERLRFTPYRPDVAARVLRVLDDAPTTAPSDHGPLAAPLSDRTLAKVLSRPAYDPPSPTKDAIVEAAIRWYEIRNAHAADVTPLQLFDADDALNMAVKAHHAAVTS